MQNQIKNLKNQRKNIRNNMKKKLNKDNFQKNIKMQCNY